MHAVCMVAEQTSPHGLKKYTAGTDLIPGRTGHNSLVDVLNTIPGCGLGPLSARPDPSKGLRFWVEESTSKLFVNTGTVWAGVADVGAVAPSDIKVGGSATEGVSVRAARADHIHNLPLATSAAHGGMSSTDKAKLDAASSVAGANTLIQANASGDFAVNTPTSGAHPTTKAYVDSQINTRAEKSHEHDGGDITSGLINQARIANATPSLNGLMSNSDKTLMDTATPNPTFSALARRDSSGALQVIVPAGTGLNYAVNRGYVDSAITAVGNASANSVHKHAAADITTGVLSAARIPAATQATAGALSATDKKKLDSASATSTPDTLMMTDANGRFSATAPTAGGHLANKSYVDTAASNAGNLTSGTVNPARIANASSTVDGLMSTIDKVKLDKASSSATAGTLMMTDDEGRFSATAPLYSNQVATKSYVDNKNWSGSDITTGLVSPARIANVSSITDGLMSRTDKAKLDEASTSGVNNLVTRNSGGTTRVNGLFIDDAATPSANMAVRKDYVDGKKWSGSDITTGTIDPERISNATNARDGLMPKTDKYKLDMASVSAAANALAMRDSSGGVRFNTVFSDGTQSSSTSALTRKDYVDGALNKKGPAPEGWVNLNLRTGWEPYANYGVPQARLVGDKVELRGVVNKTTGAPGDIIFSLPTDLIPLDNRLLVVSVMPNALSVATVTKSSGTFSVTSDATIMRVGLDGLYFHI